MFESKVTIRSGHLDADQQIPADKSLSVLKEHVFGQATVCETFAQRQVAIAESDGYTSGTCPRCNGPGGLDPADLLKKGDAIGDDLDANPWKALCAACGHDE
jgi:hypothetical protein